MSLLTGLQFVALLLLLLLVVEPQPFDLHVNITAKTTATGFVARCELPNGIIWSPAAGVQDFAVLYFSLFCVISVFAKLLTLFDFTNGGEWWG